MVCSLKIKKSKKELIHRGGHKIFFTDRGLGFTIL